MQSISKSIQNSLLLHGASDNDLKKVEGALAHGADINARHGGRTAWMEASIRFSDKVREFLERRGATVTEFDRNKVKDFIGRSYSMKINGKKSFRH